MASSLHADLAVRMGLTRCVRCPEIYELRLGDVPETTGSAADRQPMSLAILNEGRESSAQTGRSAQLPASPPAKGRCQCGTGRRRTQAASPAVSNKHYRGGPRPREAPWRTSWARWAPAKPPRGNLRHIARRGRPASASLSDAVRAGPQLNSSRCTGGAP